MISIIIPTYNKNDLTYECIQSILANTPSGFELIIIDNGSEIPFALPFLGFNDGKVIRNEENLGFPKAVNQGIRAARGEYIILLNNDVFVTPEWTDKLIIPLINDEYSLTGPMTNYVAGMQVAQPTTYYNLNELYKSAQEWAENWDDYIEEVNFVIGFCMAFKKQLFDEIGEFDESLWPCSGEEIDWCFRVREKEYHIGIVAGCYVHHEGSQTFKEMGYVDQKYNELCARNDKHLESKWGKDFWQRQPIIIQEGELNGSGI